jgi:hypothetical protein
MPLREHHLRGGGRSGDSQGLSLHGLPEAIGTAFRTNISSLPGTFRLKTGTTKIYVKTAESGNKRAHGFCPECGTPIYATAPDPNPSTYGLRVGGIDQRAQFAPPAHQIWCRSALPWSMDLQAVEKAERE